MKMVYLSIYLGLSFFFSIFDSFGEEILHIFKKSISVFHDFKIVIASHLLFHFQLFVTSI